LVGLAGKVEFTAAAADDIVSSLVKKNKKLLSAALLLNKNTVKASLKALRHEA